MSFCRVAIAVFIAFSCSSAQADTGTADLQQRVEQLERVINVLQQRLEAVESGHEKRAEMATSAPSVVAAPRQEVAPRATIPAAPAVPLRFNGEFRLYFDSITRAEGGHKAKKLAHSSSLQVDGSSVPPHPGTRHLVRSTRAPTVAFEVAGRAVPGTVSFAELLRLQARAGVATLGVRYTDPP